MSTHAAARRDFANQPIFVWSSYASTICVSTISSAWDIANAFQNARWFCVRDNAFRDISRAFVFCGGGFSPWEGARRDSFRRVFALAAARATDKKTARAGSCFG